MLGDSKEWPRINPSDLLNLDIQATLLGVELVHTRVSSVFTQKN